MAKPSITIGAIRALATPESLARGRDYVRRGAVSQLTRRGAEIRAEVEGSEINPYDVAVRLHDGGVADASCTCPYEWDGYCKHIVAVLITIGERPDDVVERPAISKLLGDLDKGRLIELIERRLQSDPGLAKWIEAELATALEPAASKRKGARRTPVDPAPVREQAQALIRARYRRRRYWDDYRPSGDEAELERLVAKATPFLEAGDGRNALRVLQPIGETFVSAWLDEAYGSHDEHMYLLFDDIARLIAEAALMSDLAPAERDDLAEGIEEWRKRLSEYGAGEAFSMTLQALETGWEDPALQAVLAGQARTWPPRGRGDDVDEQLTDVRLRVLEAGGRTEEYLRLAKAARAHVAYASMLVKLDRTAEAVTYASQRFKTPSEAHDLAKYLRKAGDDANALAIAGAGLALKGEGADGVHGQAPLAHWLRDYAGALGKTKLALKAAIVAFEQTLSMENFRAVEAWAGKAWTKVRRDLLTHLARAQHAQDRTLIYLEEGLIDEAVRSAGEPHAYASDEGALLRLAEAAHASHSDWVIRYATAMAATIMDNNRAAHYAEAARWLEKAALAFEAAGRDADWARTLDALIDKHRRKYKLRPLLEALR